MHTQKLESNKTLFRGLALACAAVAILMAIVFTASPAYAQATPPSSVERQFNIVYGDNGFGYGGGDAIPPRVQNLLDELRSNLRTLLNRIFGR